MTFAAEAAPVLWITGLAGAGKSTLASAVVEALRRQSHAALLLDGDALTAALEPTDGPRSHAPAERLRRAWRTARLANLVASQGVTAVVATISLFHEVQAWNRRQTPPLLEVLMRADLSDLAQRRPHLYGPQGKDIVGQDIPAQYPQQPDLLLTQDWLPSSLAENTKLCLELWERIKSRRGHS